MRGVRGEEVRGKERIGEGRGKEGEEKRQTREVSGAWEGRRRGIFLFWEMFKGPICKPPMISRLVSYALLFPCSTQGSRVGREGISQSVHTKSEHTKVTAQVETIQKVTP